jgi:hypothetical protein
MIRPLSARNPDLLSCYFLDPLTISVGRSRGQIETFPITACGTSYELMESPFTRDVSSQTEIDNLKYHLRSELRPDSFQQHPEPSFDLAEMSLVLKNPDHASSLSKSCILRGNLGHFSGNLHLSFMRGRTDWKSVLDLTVVEEQR